MHEWALAEAVVASVREHVPSGGRVTAVHVVIGELQAIDREVLTEGIRLQIDDAAKAAPFPMDALQIEAEPATFRCTACDASFGFGDLPGLDEHDREAVHFLPETVHAYLRCPRCSSVDYEVTQGRGLFVRAIEVETP